LQITVHESLTIRDIHFIHEPCDEANGFRYTFSGHLHPAYVMQGTGKQRLRLPCFYFGQHCGILPAFGHFTGHASIDTSETDIVFVIAGKTIIRAQ
jgi:metallophosphoesterase superfamily enzyme